LFHAERENPERVSDEPCSARDFFLFQAVAENARGKMFQINSPVAAIQKRSMVGSTTAD
jgi:hypothetical protein